MTPFLVKKCVCHDISIADVKEYVLQHNIKSVQELQAANICSTKCHMCEPYMELMLETGQVEFQPGAYVGRKKSS